MSIQEENRRDAYYDVQQDAPTRRWYIANILRLHPGGMTAEEILQVLLDDGIIATIDPNYARPRLTELCDAGIIEAVGKKKSPRTGKSVTVWELKEERRPR